MEEKFELFVRLFINLCKEYNVPEPKTIRMNRLGEEYTKVNDSEIVFNLTHKGKMDDAAYIYSVFKEYFDILNNKVLIKG